MSARIEPAAQPYPADVQAWLDRLMPEGVPPLTLFTIMARDARLFERFMASGLLDRGNLTMRQREIVIDRVTAQNGSEYEWGVHIHFFAERVNLTEDEVHSLAHGSAADPCWPEDEALLIKVCDELHETSNVGDGLWEALRQYYSEEALIEILMLAGGYRRVAYLTNALRIPLEDFAARFPKPKPPEA